MAISDPHRKTEAALSLGGIALLLLMLFLVYGAKRATAPQGSILINAAKAEAFAKTLDVDKVVAERIVAHREAKHGFGSSDELYDIPLFPKEERERLPEAWNKIGRDLFTATATDFENLLRLPAPLAKRLASIKRQLTPPTTPEALQKQTKRLFNSATLLAPGQVRPAFNLLLVRTPFSVFTHFWLGAFVLLLMLFFAPPLLRTRIKGDPYLIPIALLLAGCGVVLLFSVKDPLRDVSAYENHLWGVTLSLVVLVFSSRLTPYARQRLRNYQYVWVFASALILVALFLFGTGPAGVKLSLFRFQPVEIVKILLVFFIAAYLSDRAELIADTTPEWKPQGEGRLAPRLFKAPPRLRDIGPIAVLYTFALLLFVVVRDLGPGLLLFGTVLSVLYLLTGRGGFIWLGVALLFVGAFIAYRLQFGVFGTRVDMWLHPFSNVHPNGMQLGQGYWGMATGGWEGSGLGLGLIASMPRGGSDLAFASWAEETGFFGAWFALALYALLVWRGLQIALKANNEMDRALAFGLTSLLGMQTLLILCGVTGVVPLSGISLPFLSYGNSALIANFFVIGLLRAISANTPKGGERIETRQEVHRATHRYGIAYLSVLFGLVGVWRLGAIQIVQANDIATRAIFTPDADKQRRAHINPRLLLVERSIERGSIYDREERVLATSRPKEIRELVRDVQKANRLIASRKRYYPYGAACAHIVGYLDGSVGGPYGLEQAYHDDLRGFAEYADLLKDYRNRYMPFQKPRAALSLHLALDAELQKETYALLWKSTQRLRDKKTGKPKDRAAFVLLEPQTGAIRVAVSIPSFDPNALTQETYQEMTQGEEAKLEAPLVNRAIAGLYPPGSTFKIATALVALDTIPSAETFTVACNQIAPEIRWRAGGKRYTRRNVRDDKGDPKFGNIALANGFRVSSNIYFANLAVEVGSAKFREELADKLRFRALPAPENFDADLPDIGYGQGRLLVSPLEMARLTGAVAAGGTMMRPTLLKPEKPAPAPPEGDPASLVKKQAPISLGEATSPQTAAKLRELMRSVTLSGTARGVFDSLPYEVAGKTGTAQNKQADREPHSWFVGFAPYSVSLSPPPRYAFACMVENGGYGKRVAAVICKEVLSLAIR